MWYLNLVINVEYSCCFLTSLTLVCITLLDDKNSSRQQFVRLTTSWRRSFLQLTTVKSNNCWIWEIQNWVGIWQLWDFLNRCNSDQKSTVHCPLACTRKQENRFSKLSCYWGWVKCLTHLIPVPLLWTEHSKLPPI